VKKKTCSKAIGDDGKGSIVIGVRSTKRLDWPKKNVDSRVGVGCSPIIFCQNAIDGLDAVLHWRCSKVDYWLV
jgi:hypothetical protein